MFRSSQIFSGTHLGTRGPVHKHEITIPERGNPVTPQLTKYSGEGNRGMRISQMPAQRANRRRSAHTFANKEGKRSDIADILRTTLLSVCKRRSMKNSTV
jgi:hypothetical protein